MISTHILDTSLGQPARDVLVQLCDVHGTILAQAKTNLDGRIAHFENAELSVGAYCLSFATSEYFQSMGSETFFPKVIIHFSISDLKQHFHIPLLISPFAYSTYRGS